MTQDLGTDPLYGFAYGQARRLAQHMCTQRLMGVVGLMRVATPVEAAAFDAASDELLSRIPARETC